MCSRSDRFIAFQNLHPFVLRHKDGERGAVPHPASFFAPVVQERQHPWQPLALDDLKPLRESVLGLDGILRVSQPLLDPVNHQLELDRFALQHRSDDLMHFIVAFFDDPMPVRRAGLDHLRRRIARLLAAGPGMKYRRLRRGGFVLYSVGLNERDDWLRNA
jgi:hypothetical protein